MLWGVVRIFENSQTLSQTPGGEGGGTLFGVK